MGTNIHSSNGIRTLDRIVCGVASYKPTTNETTNPSLFPRVVTKINCTQRTKLLIYYDTSISLYSCTPLFYYLPPLLWCIVITLRIKRLPSNETAVDTDILCIICIVCGRLTTRLHTEKWQNLET
jgi:hypothetical protein